jgi:hypothetical protein
VLLIGLDGLSFEAVSPDRMPRLWQLGADGGRAPDGGRTGLPATTYPSFATLLTGSTVETHGVRTTARRDGAVPGWAGDLSTQVPTLVDACREAAVDSWCVVGDQNLWDVLKLGDVPGWPGSSTVPVGTALDPHGYADDSAVTAAALTFIREWHRGFAFVHYNASDSFGHDSGPASAESVAAHRRLDMELGRLFDALSPGWASTLLVVVSDHDMQARSPEPEIDLSAAVWARHWLEDLIGDGGAGWVLVARGHNPNDAAERLASLDGVRCATVIPGTRRVLIACDDGRVLAGDSHTGGIHGGPGTQRTHALIGGGAAIVNVLAESIERRPPNQSDWAPTLASLLGVSLPAAEGLDLLAGLPAPAGWVDQNASR